MPLLDSDFESDGAVGCGILHERPDLAVEHLRVQLLIALPCGGRLPS